MTDMLNTARLRALLLSATGVVVLALGLTVTPAGPALADQMKPLLTKIVNTPAEPVPVRDVDRPGAQQPLALGQRLLGLNQDHATLVTVPEGKRLVIEFITVAASMRSDLRPGANINVVSDGKNSQHGIAMNAVQTSGGITRYASTHMVRLYADPGAKVTFFIGFSPSDPEWNDRIAAVSLSGYLMDAT